MSDADREAPFPEAPPSAPVAGVRAVVTDWLPVALALVVMIAAIVIVHLQKSMWLDEGITLDQTGGTLDHLFESTRLRSNKPPLYYLVVWVWRLAWPGIDGVRALSTLGVVLAVLAMDRIGRELGTGRGAWSLGVLAALTAHIAWAGTEGRAYAMALALVACATWLFARIWITGTDHARRDTVLFVAACYGAILTYYYSGFVLAGLFVGGLLALPGRRRLVASGAALGALLLPWSLMVAGQFQRHHSYRPDVSFGGPGVLSVGWNAVRWAAGEVSHTVHRTVPLYDGPLRQLAFVALLLGIAGLRLWQVRGRLTAVERWATAYAAVAVGTLMVLRILNRTTVDERHLVISAIPVLVFASVLASRLRPVRLAHAAQVALLAASVAGLVSLARHERGSADWHSAIRWVMAAERPGQPIVAFNSDPNALVYYYHGPNTLERIPIDESTRKDDGLRMELTPVETARLRALLARSVRPGLVFWLIERQSPLRGPSVVQDHIGQPVSILERRTYFNIVAYRLSLSRPVEP